MAQTVIGFFEQQSDAQKAIQRLAEIGISRDQVDITNGSGSIESTSRDVDSSHRNDDNAITRFFKNLFGDDNDDADRYARVGNQGYTIVTVHAASEDEAESAATLLDDCGAIDVDETAERYSATEGRTTQNMSGQTQSYSGASQRGTEDDVTIPRVEEELQVGKRSVERGTVRVRSRIVEKPVEESIRLREEHVHVERQAVNRPVSDTDRNAFQEQDIELTEMAEVPVVNKEARVVEEIRISKDVNERNETVRDTVRNTEVDVDDVNRGNVNNDNLTTDNDLRDDRLTGNRGVNRSDDDLI